MKAAIFHDYFDEIGGAEITALNIAKILNAKIFTTNIDPKLIKSLGFSDIEIISIGKVPCVKHAKQLLAKARFYFLNKSKFDIYIFIGHNSLFATRNHTPNIWFCPGIERGLYFSKNRVFFKKPLIYLDRKNIRNINKIISNSKNTRDKIEKIYNRKSSTIYSPINTDSFYFSKPKDYWLSVSRIDPYKRVEFIINCFKNMPDENLVIIGGASDENMGFLKRIKNSAPKNVKLLGPLFEVQRISDLYANCKGLIVAAKDEDFGKTVIEAMASGKPVIAPNEGGYKETIISGKTGILIDDINENKIIDSIKFLNKNLEQYKEACTKRAKSFDIKIFSQKLKKEIKFF